jgi:hypothetical protein
MDERCESIRVRAFSVLAFLASRETQRMFADRNHFPSYQGEFWCWWSDTFTPDDLVCFSAIELPAFKEFAEQFDSLYRSLGNEPTTIENLLASPIWGEVVSSAEHACARLGIEPDALANQLYILARPPGGRPRSVALCRPHQSSLGPRHRRK